MVRPQHNLEGIFVDLSIREENLVELIYLGREQRNLDYKQSMSWNDPTFKISLTKCILAMSNIRDGGYIVIGVRQNSDGSFDPDGMQQSDMASFNQDNVSAQVAEFADPFASFDLIAVENADKKFIVIRVKEFEEIPVICKRDYGNELHRGKIYSRTRRMPECAEVLSSSEMREIIELATQKQMNKVQGLISDLIQSSQATAIPDEELYNREAEDAYAHYD